MNNKGKIIVSLLCSFLFIIIIIFIIRHKRKQKSISTMSHILNKINSKYNFNEDVINRNLCNIPIYFINMERSVDRLHSMIKQIDFYKIQNIHRVEAVDGSQILNKYNDFYTFSNGEMLHFDITHFNDYSMGELGCVLSHLNTIKCSYERGYEYCLILEDDVYLGLIMLWDKTLCDVINNAPVDWGILQLFAGNTRVTNINEYKIWDNYWGMQAYIMNRQGMKKIVDTVCDGNTVIINNRIPTKKICSDHLIYSIINNSELKAYTTKALFIPNNSEMDSTIHKDHTQLHVSSSNNSLSMYHKSFERFKTKQNYIIQQIKEDYKIKL